MIDSLKRIYCFFQRQDRFKLHAHGAELNGLEVDISSDDQYFQYTHNGIKVIGQMFTVEKLNAAKDADVIRFEDFFPKEMEKFQAIQHVAYKQGGEVWMHGGLHYRCDIKKAEPSAPQQQTFPRNALTVKKYIHNFEVGDVVQANRNTPLHCGSGIYTHAIVVQSEPLVLVSEETDMRWSATVDELYLEKIGVAKPEVLEKCMRRLEK